MIRRQTLRWSDIVAAVPRPFAPPIGLRLTATARTVERAFDAALAAAGGTRPTWLVLLALKRHPASNQREIAAVVGIQGATLTQHLNGMEDAGLLVRRRDPGNRRVHVVELTEAGEQTFLRLRSAAAAFDRRLREGLDDEDVSRFTAVLERLEENVTRPVGR
jgi:MarR family transcriptional regulator for hemolysin